VEKVFFFASENEVHILTKTKTLIILTLEEEKNQTDPNLRLESIKKQLIGLKNYIDQNTKSIQDGSITYIDARIIKKLFLCKERDSCKSNLIRVYGEVYRNIF
jgi:hypothetical protein